MVVYKERSALAIGLTRNTAVPVALVSTKTNFLTVAMIQCFSHDPQTIGIGIKRERYSHDLIAAEGGFVVNLVANDGAELLNAAGAVSGRDGDKFAALGLTAEPAESINSSLIAECHVNLECRLIQQFEVAERTWFVGQVLVVHQSMDWFAERAMLYTGGVYHALGGVVGQRE